MNGVIHENECHLFEPKLCTFKGIRESFIKHAKEASRKKNTGETENEDILIFFFSGHGIVNDQTELVGLAPVDYDGTEKTCITSEIILTWLQSSGCRANILFIIDACYSGGFHESSSYSESTDSPPDPNACNVYVMYSCTSEQKCYEHGILQHSIFSYCLSHAITANAVKKCFSMGLPIKDLEETYTRLTYAICLLLDIEAQSPGLNKFLMTTKPSMGAKGSVNVEYGEISEEPMIGSACEPMSLQLSLNQESLDWIERCATEGGPFDKLKREGHLEKREVLDIVLCFMMRFIACSHVYITNHSDFFPYAYDEVINTLSKFTKLEFGDRERKLGAKEYEDYLKQHFKIQSTLASRMSNLVSGLKLF